MSNQSPESGKGAEHAQWRAPRFDDPAAAKAHLDGLHEEAFGFNGLGQEPGGGQHHSKDKLQERLPYPSMSQRPKG